MNRRLPSQRVLAGLVVVSLGLMTALGSSSGPPEIGIADLSIIDGGAVVRVRGVVVDAWSSDSGTLTLVLADLSEESTVKVVCSQGILQVGADVHVGDEVRTTGQLEITGGRPILWSSSDEVELLGLSRATLKLDDLARAWELLIGDRFEIVGILLSEQRAGPLRLMAPDGTMSIALETTQTDSSRFADRKVLVDGVLQLRPKTMELVFVAYAISATD